MPNGSGTNPLKLPRESGVVSEPKEASSLPAIKTWVNERQLGRLEQYHFDFPEAPRVAEHALKMVGTVEEDLR